AHATITARAAAAATINLGPAKSYSGTAKPSASLTGLDIAVAANPSATGIPKEGIDVFLSDKLADKVKDAIKKNCKDKIDTKCYQSVQTILQSKDVNLQARQLGVIAVLAGGVTLFIGIVTPYLFSHDKNIPVPIHIGPDELSQISLIGTKTEIHVATATSGGSIFTVTQPPKPTKAAGPVPTISTLTAPSGKLGKGDVVVSIPKDFAAKLQDFIAMESGCKGYKKMKRAIDAACLQSAAEGLVLNAAPGGALDGLFFVQGVAFQIGGIARREYVQALNNVQQFAAGLAGQLNIDNKKAATLGALAFALVYKVYIDGQSLTEQNVFAANEIGTATITNGPTSTAAGCPSDAPKTDGPNPLCCQDNDCKGDKKENLCGTGKWKGCQCLNLVSYPPFDQYDTAIGNDQATILASLFGNGKGAKEPTSTKFCHHAASPKNYKGSGWCECGNGKTYAETSKDITTTDDAGSKTVLIDVCPYTTPPASEFKPTPISTAAPAKNTCSGPTNEGTEECSKWCAPRAGVCSHSGFGKE
ncbi:MAG: hypothetical protein M1830_005152, partial [Pleopsidium flavum]